MKKLFAILIISLLLNFTLSRDTTLSITAITRHGARSTDKYANVAFKLNYETERYQLTHLGLIETNHLGRALRETYSDFFEKAKIFTLKSSPKHRCIFSAIGVLLGLYPNSDVNFKNMDETIKLDTSASAPGYEKDKNKEQIELELADKNKNYIFFAEGCQYKGKKVSSYLPETKVFKTDIKELAALYEKMKRRLVSNFKNLVHENEWNFENPEKLTERTLENLISFVLIIREQSNKEQREALTFDREEELLIRKIHINNFYHNRLDTEESNEYPLGLKLMNTFLFSDVLTQFENSTHSQPLFSLYSAHDLNVVSTLAFFTNNQKLLKFIRESDLTDEKIYSFIIPPFASSILILLEETSLRQKYVKVIYNNKDISDLLHEDLKDEQGKIPYSKFTSFVKRRIHSKEDREWGTCASIKTANYY